MKKYLGMLFVMLISFTLVACGPKTMEEVEISAQEIFDDYNCGRANLSVFQTQVRLKDLSKQAGTAVFEHLYREWIAKSAEKCNAQVTYNIFELAPPSVQKDTMNIMLEKAKNNGKLELLFCYLEYGNNILTPKQELLFAQDYFTQIRNGYVISDKDLSAGKFLIKNYLDDDDDTFALWNEYLLRATKQLIQEGQIEKAVLVFCGDLKYDCTIKNVAIKKILDEIQIPKYLERKLEDELKKYADQNQK